MTEEEYVTLKYHVSILNRVAHPKQEISRDEIASIYNAKISQEPANFCESQKNTILAAYDRINCRDVHVSTLQHISRYESIHIYNNTFSKFGRIAQIMCCGGDIHIRFCTPEGVRNLCKKSVYYMEYTGYLHYVAIPCKQFVSIQRVHIDTDYCTYFSDS